MRWECCDEALIGLFLHLSTVSCEYIFSVGSAGPFVFFVFQTVLILNIFGLARSHGKYLLFKLAHYLPARHLNPYYAEVFLASSFLYLNGRRRDVPGK